MGERGAAIVFASWLVPLEGFPLEVGSGLVVDELSGGSYCKPQPSGL